MALPADGQNANGLTKVTQIPAGKELMFIDPTTNEGGIITLEDLTKQILNGLASQAFALDAGQMTLPAALNYLYGKSLYSKDIKELPTDSNTQFAFNVVTDIRTEHITIPKYSKGILIAFGDAILIGVDITGKLYAGYRNNNKWSLVYMN